MYPRSSCQLRSTLPDRPPTLAGFFLVLTVAKVRRLQSRRLHCRELEWERSDRESPTSQLCWISPWWWICGPSTPKAHLEGRHSDQGALALALVLTIGRREARLCYPEHPFDLEDPRSFPPLREDRASTWSSPGSSNLPDFASVAPILHGHPPSQQLSNIPCLLLSTTPTVTLTFTYLTSVDSARASLRQYYSIYRIVVVSCASLAIPGADEGFAGQADSFRIIRRNSWVGHKSNHTPPEDLQ